MRHLLSILICSVAIAQPPIPPAVDAPDSGDVVTVPVAFEWDASENGVSYQLRWGTNSSTSTTNLSATLWLPLGATNEVYVVAISPAQIASEPSNIVSAYPHYVPWLVVGTTLQQSDSITGPFTPTGTNRIAFTNTPAGVAKFWVSQATITAGRDLNYE